MKNSFNTLLALCGVLCLALMVGTSLSFAQSQIIAENVQSIEPTSTSQGLEVTVNMQDATRRDAPVLNKTVKTEITPKNVSLEFVTVGTCGDKLCDKVNGETRISCPTDCGDYCGDGVCSAGAGENAATCIPDCTTCGDGTCGENENCNTCPGDCINCCGDGVCDTSAAVAENCQSCVTDCGACPVVCGQFGCQSGETCSNCSADCGACGPGCFVAGTMITMFDGSLRAIETIKAGDHILAFDERTKQFKPDKVTKTLKHISPGYILVNNHLKITGNHPVWTNGTWRHIGKLKAGDTLLNEKGEAEVIKTMETVKGNITTYNFEVNPYHTYIAGGIVVHNGLAQNEACQLNVNCEELKEMD